MVIDSLIYNGMCSCGKEHKMKTDFCIIESGCLKDIKKYKTHLKQFPVFSEEHAQAIHKLEYLYYKLEYLLKEVVEFGHC